MTILIKKANQKFDKGKKDKNDSKYNNPSDNFDRLTMDTKMALKKTANITAYLLK